MRNIVERTSFGKQSDIKFFGINGPERLFKAKPHLATKMRFSFKKLQKITNKLFWRYLN